MEMACETEHGRTHSVMEMRMDILCSFTVSFNSLLLLSGMNIICIISQTLLYQCYIVVINANNVAILNIYIYNI